MKKILFVCLGNICRSAAAEGVMQAKINKAGLNKQIFIDSAGIIGVHAGEHADARMRKSATRRGYDLTSISRQVCTNDFEKFDLIIGMDNQNIRDLQKLTNSENELNKIHLMTEYCQKYNTNCIPDPYYGGEDGFEYVLDLLEDACDGLLKQLKILNVEK